MSSKQNNDQGYNSVMKEYDYYNNNINDDFEIIDDIPNSYIMPENNNKNTQNNNNTMTDSKLEKTKKKLENFITNIYKIIFDSRNKLSEFSSKSRKKLNEIKKENDIFNPEIEDLLGYDYLKAWDESDGSKKKKYIIEFYLIQNDNKEDTNSLKSVRINGKPKLLVERWKIKYKENYKGNYNLDDNLMDIKMKLIEKNIISYSRILPLFNICKDNNYFIEFKFNPIKNEKKNFVKENLSRKIKIKNEELFNFKLSIKYLKIDRDNLDDLFKASNNEFVIISKKKSRRRFLSDTYYKKSSHQLLKKESEEQKDNNNEINNDNNNIINNDFIIENYFNDENDNNVNQKRRLSVQEKEIKSKFFVNNFKQKKSKSEESDSNANSSDDNLSLVISETDNDGNINIDNITKDIKEKNNNQNKNKKDISVRKCQTFREKSKNELKESNIIKSIEFKNIKIKKIVKEYKNIKKMIKMMPNYGNINCDKLNTFITND